MHAWKRQFRFYFIFHNQLEAMEWLNCIKKSFKQILYTIFFLRLPKGDAFNVVCSAVVFSSYSIRRWFSGLRLRSHLGRTAKQHRLSARNTQQRILLYFCKQFHPSSSSPNPSALAMRNNKLSAQLTRLSAEICINDMTCVWCRCFISCWHTEAMVYRVNNEEFNSLVTMYRCSRLISHFCIAQSDTHVAIGQPNAHDDAPSEMRTRTQSHTQARNSEIKRAASHSRHRRITHSFGGH